MKSISEFRSLCEGSSIELETRYQYLVWTAAAPGEGYHLGCYRSIYFSDERTAGQCLERTLQAFDGLKSYRVLHFELRKCQVPHCIIGHVRDDDFTEMRRDYELRYESLACDLEEGLL